MSVEAVAQGSTVTVFMYSSPEWPMDDALTSQWDDAVLAVYPTQLFEVAIAGLMFLYLWPRRHHDHRDGWLAGVWMILAGAERLFVELFRAKDDRILGAISVAQLLSLALIALGAYLVAKLREPEPGSAPGA